MRLFISAMIMAVMTYLIRVIPITVLKKEITSRFVKSFLYYVPYAVLASLTFPSIFWATGNTISAMVGTGVAVILALCNRGLVLVALGAMLSAFLTGIFTG